MKCKPSLEKSQVTIILTLLIVMITFVPFSMVMFSIIMNHLVLCLYIHDGNC